MMEKGNRLTTLILLCDQNSYWTSNIRLYCLEQSNFTNHELVLLSNYSCTLSSFGNIKA